MCSSERSPIRRDGLSSSGCAAKERRRKDGALAPLIDWTSQMAGFWQTRFDHLEDLLKRMDQ